MKRKNKCNCGDENCKREIKSTKGGRLFIVNHFTCGDVKKIINNYEKLNTYNN